MGEVLFALIVIPLLSAVAFMLIPSRYPQLVRYVALVSAAVQFVLSVIVFFSYEFDGGNGLRFDFRLDWLENVGVPRGERDHALPGGRRHRGADGAADGSGDLRSGVRVVEHHVPEQGLLRPALPAGLGRLRRIPVAGPVLPLLLVRGRRAADVPADRGLGREQRLRDLHAHEGVRGDEARAVPRRRERAHLHRDLRDFRRGGHRHVRPAVAG